MFKRAFRPVILLSTFFGLMSGAHAATYQVSGTFDAVGAYEAAGEVNLFTSGSMTLTGTIVTDTDEPGYSIIDGDLSLQGELTAFLSPFPPADITVDLGDGVPSNAGILFNTGELCAATFIGPLCTRPSYASDSYPDFSTFTRFLGETISGIQLTGGSGGQSFTLTLPGGVTDTLGDDPSDWSKAITFLQVAIADVGIFAEGEVTFELIDDVPNPNPPPNIVVVQTRSDGPSTRYSTDAPVLFAELQQRGLYFVDSHVSNPSATPSLATLLTGRYAHNHKVFSNVSPNALEGGLAWDGWLPSGSDPGQEGSTLATWLRDAGYRTGFVGKYLAGYGEVAPDSVADPATYIPDGWDDWHGLVGRSATYMYNYDLNENGTVVSYGEEEQDYQTDVLATKAVDFVSEDNPAPFFLLVSTSAPGPETLDATGFLSSIDPMAHLDLRIRPPQRYIYLIDGDPANGEQNVTNTDLLTSLIRSGMPSCPRGELSEGLVVVDRPYCSGDSPDLTEADVENATQRIKWSQASFRAVDDLVGDVIDALRARNQLDNTVIVFTSATGEMQGDFEQVSKTLGYRDATHVPLFVRAPGTLLTNQRMTREFIANTDLAPTLADFAGVTPPYETDGFSRMDAFKARFSAGMPERKNLLLEHWFMPTFYKFESPSFLGWRGPEDGGYNYISTRADPDNIYQATARELVRNDFREDSLVQLPSDLGHWFDIALEVFQACEGAVCQQYEAP